MAYIPGLILLKLGSYVSKLLDSVYNRFPKMFIISQIFCLCCQVMTDDLRVIMAGRFVVSFIYQGHFVCMCEEGGIAILDFKFKAHTSERNLLRLNR